jgi:hypothetical protein
MSCALGIHVLSIGTPFWSSHPPHVQT